MAKDTESNNKKRSISSVIALIVACVALILSPVPIVNNFAFVLALISLIFSIVGIVKTRNGKLTGRKTSAIALIITIIAGAVVLGSQSFYGNEIDKAGKEVQKSIDKSTGNSTATILKNDVSVTLGEFSVSTDNYGLVTSELPVTVTNKLNSPKTYSIDIEIVDSSGKRLDKDTVYADKLWAKQTQDFKAFQYIDPGKVEAFKAGKFKIVSVSEY
mgnify:CR=1 FL=1